MMAAKSREIGQLAGRPAAAPCPRRARLPGPPRLWAARIIRARGSSPDPARGGGPGAGGGFRTRPGPRPDGSGSSRPRAAGRAERAVP